MLLKLLSDEELDDELDSELDDVELLLVDDRLELVELDDVELLDWLLLSIRQ